MNVTCVGALFWIIYGFWIERELRRTKPNRTRNHCQENDIFYFQLFFFVALSIRKINAFVSKNTKNCENTEKITWKKFCNFCFPPNKTTTQKNETKAERKTFIIFSVFFPQLIFFWWKIPATFCIWVMCCFDFWTRVESSNLTDFQ